MRMDDAVELIDAITRFAYNAEFEEFREIYEGTSDVPRQVMDGDHYLWEKYHMMSHRLETFFAVLDDAHRRKLIQVAVKRYNAKQGGKYTRNLQVNED